MNQEHQAMEAENKKEWEEVLQSKDGAALLEKMSSDALSSLEKGELKPMDFSSDE